MATIPKQVTLTNSSIDILNAIRNSATTNYRDYVPIATKDADSIREIGAIIMDYPNLQNEFLSALVNRIGRVIIKSKMYSNPWAVFKKGILEFGESVEEIFVNIAEGQTYDAGVAETELFKRAKSDVRSAFHIMNYQKFYKATVQQEQLRQAFLSWQGITDLITAIINAMYTGANYDEFVVMKYMLAKHIVNGRIKVEAIPSNSTADMRDVAKVIKGISNDMTFLKNDYNTAGVMTQTLQPNQYLIMNAKFAASMDIDVLANAFNMDKAEFMGHQILVDSFGALDMPRLKALIGNDAGFVEFGDEVIAKLNDIPAIIVDDEFFMVYDNNVNFTEVFNAQGMYWNYFLHLWKTFSVSPFANAVVFSRVPSGISGLTITPSSVMLSRGSAYGFTVDVEVTGFASKAVDWAVSMNGSDEQPKGVTISKTGVLVIADDAATGEYVVKATSIANPAVTDIADVLIQ